jgi:hypothetical protein
MVRFFELALMAFAGKCLLQLSAQLTPPAREHALGHAKSSRAIWATLCSVFSLRRTASTLKPRL